ncbi:FeS assembly protein SufD [Caldalkalibacillus thermarum TA2.A1]|uniref:Fe-S cluster assembly protein SufD n=1 Tax=Caldalkalibacillus thermarum (strain TA2.A1) TaxID=986075 RepID=F5L7I3_CALTT|nr:Fe-S cluster assembly protein SufD [Caldalkalibacillus thermarum]EGL82697.1 FeS assembly protein SufD [Caldalkalibacillus thermarum TA2.A1]QZT33759.1 Fe-S cluster assembly protein SufD [Caldalkalibacillus thermarum TA2.A1]
MTVETKTSLTRDYITGYSRQQGEPEWLLNLRLRGFELSDKLELPKPEKTNITDWNLLNFTHHVEESPISSVEELPHEVKRVIGDEQGAGNVVIHKNGRPVFQALSEDLKNKGVIFTDLQTAVKQHGDLIQRYLAKLVEIDEHKLTAIHTALINSGIFLYVPKNVEVNVPLQSVFWQENGHVGLIPHILIVAEDNSKVTYVENMIGAEQGKAVNNYVAEVFVGPGAKVTFAAVDNLGKDVTNYVYRRATVDRDGHIDWALGQMHDGNTVSDNLTILKGDGSTGDSKSVVIGRGEQSQNFVQKMIHYGRSSDGQILGHAVMKDAARAIFNGISKIEKGAAKANGEQTERVLMLSDKARGDANPILLIDEDDVTAGHAASVGQVDKMQLYYLMSRGIPQTEAERLIILGFLNPVVEKIPLEGMKKRLIEVIERKVK